MANEIKELFGASTAFDIDLGGLASSTAGAGKQSAIVDNTSTRFRTLLIFAKLKLGTSPTGNKAATIYFIRSDGSGNRTDAAGSAKGSLTVKNAQVIGQLSTGSSPATGDVLQDWFVVENPGREFGVAVVHDSVAALDATNGNHDVRYYGANPEVQ